jgi:hypothetical protein
VDENGDGQIQFNEFKNMMMGDSLHRIKKKWSKSYHVSLF